MKWCANSQVFRIKIAEISQVIYLYLWHFLAEYVIIAVGYALEAAAE